MNHLIHYNIFESVMNIDDIYNKWYSDMGRVVFDKIIASDPTTKPNKLGVYCKWLLKLWNSKLLKIEDLYKATNYLKLFHRFKYKLPIKDILKIEDLPTLFKLVEPFVDKEEYIFSNEEERKLAGQFKEVFKNFRYRIIIPFTLQASQYFGQGTEWCTTHSNMFNHYTLYQNIKKPDENSLFIFYNENPEYKMQFHFKSRQFKDAGDYDVDLPGILHASPDVKEYFESIVGNLDKFIYAPDVFINKSLKKMKIKKSEKNDLWDMNSIEEWEENTKNYNWRSEYDLLISDFYFDENPMDGSSTAEFVFICGNEIKFTNFISFLKDSYETEIEPYSTELNLNKNTNPNHKILNKATIYP